MNKVRVNSVYSFSPTWLDAASRPGTIFHEGDRVRVVNLYGCPPANTMGHCYVIPADAMKDSRGNYTCAFALVQTASLVKVEPKGMNHE